MEIPARAEAWAAQARTKLHNGGLTEADLDELVAAVRVTGQPPLQRLLYLRSVTPSIRSQVIGMALHEPVRDAVTQITATSEWPYTTVHDAILAGWPNPCPHLRGPQSWEPHQTVKNRS